MQLDVALKKGDRGELNRGGESRYSAAVWLCLAHSDVPAVQGPPAVQRRSSYTGTLQLYRDASSWAGIRSRGGRRRQSRPQCRYIDIHFFSGRQKTSSFNLSCPVYSGCPGCPICSGCPGCPGCPGRPGRLLCPVCPVYPVCPVCPGCPTCPGCYTCPAYPARSPASGRVYIRTSRRHSQSQAGNL